MARKFNNHRITNEILFPCRNSTYQVVSLFLSQQQQQQKSQEFNFLNKKKQTISDFIQPIKDDELCSKIPKIPSWRHHWKPHPLVMSSRDVTAPSSSKEIELSWFWSSYLMQPKNEKMKMKRRRRTRKQLSKFDKLKGCIVAFAGQ